MKLKTLVITAVLLSASAVMLPIIKPSNNQNVEGMVGFSHYLRDGTEVYVNFNVKPGMSDELRADLVQQMKKILSEKTLSDLRG